MISKLDENGMPRLRSIVLTHGEESSRLQGRPTYQITLARNDFVDAIAKLLKKDSWIDTGSIYDQWTAPTARTILTGHYLATYHKKLFDGWNRAGNSKNEFKAATEAYWEPLAKDAGGVTRLTVSIYEELTAWGDSASASLLSVLMGTGPRTIHTRLQEARKSGYLHKPGIGSRR